MKQKFSDIVTLKTVPPLELREIEAPKISRQSALESGKVIRGRVKPRAIVQPVGFIGLHEV